MRACAVVAAGQSQNGAEAVACYREGAKERLDRVGIASVDLPLLVPGDDDSPAALGTPRAYALTILTDRMP